MRTSSNGTAAMKPAITILRSGKIPHRETEHCFHHNRRNSCTSLAV